jgi:hypothetical protein
MTRTDHKILFTALAFMSIANKEKETTGQAEQILNLAKLIEDFCAAYLPKLLCDEYHGRGGVPTSKQLLNRYTEELGRNGSAKLDYDRNTLLGMYEILLAEKITREQREFFASGPDDVIANRILQLVTEQIAAET